MTLPIPGQHFKLNDETIIFITNVYGTVFAYTPWIFKMFCKVEYKFWITEESKWSKFNYSTDFYTFKNSALPVSIHTIKMLDLKNA